MRLELLSYTNDKILLRKQYRELAKKLHPDKPGGNKERFQKLQDEFNFLSNGGIPETDKKSAESKKSTENVHQWTDDDLKDFFNKKFNINEARKSYHELLLSINNSKMNVFSKIVMKALCESIFINIYKTKP